MRVADEEIARGERGTSLDDALGELEAESSATKQLERRTLRLEGGSANLDVKAVEGSARGCACASATTECCIRRSTKAASGWSASSSAIVCTPSSTG
jgi:hypothetical protein